MELYSTREAAEIMGVHYQTIMNWIRNPNMPLEVRKVSRYYFISDEAIKEFEQFREDNPDLFTPGRPPNDTQITKTIITEDGEKKRVRLDYKNRRQELLGEDE